MSEAAFSSTEDFFAERPVSTKAAARAARRAEKQQKQTKVVKPLVPKNPAQADYLDCLRSGASVIALGPAGTGKTYLSARVAAQRMMRGDIEKIIVSRVTVSKAKHAIGFLPGNIDAKMKPWLTPVIEGIRAEVSGQLLDQWKSDGRFEIVPFEYMRGRTFENAVIILDEAQNAAFDDLTLFLTRTGEGSQVVVAGDPNQIDIPDSGLSEIASMAEEDEIMDVIEFTEEDVVRSKLAKAWVKAISKRNARVRAAREARAAEDGGFFDKPPAFMHPTSR